VVPTVNAERSTVKPFVLVSQVSLAVLQLADQNVLPVQNVHRTKLVLIKNVSIHVPELVASTPSAK
jgi:hypothetical protein